MAALEGGEGAT